MTNSSPQAIALSLLLQRLSAHFDGLAGDVFEIEQVIGNNFNQEDLKKSDTITRLQRLDFLRQSLEDLALLAHYICSETTGEVSSALSEKLRLDTTKLLLEPDKARKIRPVESDTRGELDLF